MTVCFAIIDAAESENLCSALSTQRCFIGNQGERTRQLTEQVCQLRISQLAFHNHYENIQFYVLMSTQSSLVLDLPWLQLHNPILDWCTSRILAWSPRCTHTCISHSLHIGSTSLAHVPVRVPPEYKPFLDMFSREKSDVASPQCPWDCAIDLLPGTSPPRSRVYPLSLVETNPYVAEALRQELISCSLSLLLKRRVAG